MVNASVNTDPLPLEEESSDKIHKWLKERYVKHIKIKDMKDLKQIYNFGEEIGQGAFGTVFAVQEKNSSKVWAMKTISKSLAAKRIELIQREIKVLKLVQHPHIIYLDRIYECSRKIYLILEKCNGELAQFYKDNKPISEPIARKIMSEMMSAVSYLHKYDIVHRDLKLQNILIAQNPSDPSDNLYIKLSDFGLSIVKFGTGIEGALHDYCGTLLYMSPEMITNRCYSQQCDIWAIGVILYTLVVGEYPFYANDEKKLMHRICNSPLNFPGKLQLSKEIKHFINGALSKNPVQRLTAAEMMVHPWILDKPMTQETSGNILDKIKMAERNIHGEKSDWEAQQISTKDKKPKKITNLEERQIQQEERLIRVINPTRKSTELSKIDIKLPEGHVPNKPRYPN